MCHRDPVEVKRLRIEVGNLRAQIIALTDSLRTEDERYETAFKEHEEIVSQMEFRATEMDNLETENQDLKEQMSFMEDIEDEIKAHRLFRAMAEKIFEDLRTAMAKNPNTPVEEVAGRYLDVLDWKEHYRPHPGVLAWNSGAQQRFFEQNKSYDPARTSWEEFTRNMP